MKNKFLAFGLICLGLAVSAVGCGNNNNGGGGGGGGFTGNVIFVDNEAGTDGDGSFTNPYGTLTEAQDNSEAGDIIFVFRGDGTSAGLDEGFTFKDDQVLYGEGIGLSFGGSVIVPAGDPPVIGNASDLTTGMTLANNNEVAGVELDTAFGPGIWGRDIADFNIHDNVFTANDTQGVLLEDVSGTGTIMDNTFDATGLSGVSFGNIDEATILGATVEGNTFTDCGNKGVNFSPAFDTELTVAITNNTITTTTGDGVFLHFLDDAGGAVILTGNTITGGDAYGLNSRGEGTGTFTVTVEDNTLSNNTINGVRHNVSSGSGDLTLIDNVISGNDVEGVDINIEGNGGALLGIVDNTISGNTANGIRMRALDSSGVLLISTGNTLSGNGGGSEEYLIRAQNGSNICVNQDNDTSGAFTLRQQNASTFSREPASGLVGTVNTLGTITSVGDGFCTAP